VGSWAGGSIHGEVDMVMAYILNAPHCSFERMTRRFFLGALVGESVNGEVDMASLRKVFAGIRVLEHCRI